MPELPIAGYASNAARATVDTTTAHDTPRLFNLRRESRPIASRQLSTARKDGQERERRVSFVSSVVTGSSASGLCGRWFRVGRAGSDPWSLRAVIVAANERFSVVRGVEEHDSAENWIGWGRLS